MNVEDFFLMLEQVPRISHLWDRKRRELNVDLFEKELAVMSSGEVYMAKFFASLWFNDNKRYGFDLVDPAVSSLTPDERLLIVNWVANPFWP